MPVPFAAQLRMGPRRAVPALRPLMLRGDVHAGRYREGLLEQGDRFGSPTGLKVGTGEIVLRGQRKRVI